MLTCRCVAYAMRCYEMRREAGDQRLSDIFITHLPLPPFLLLVPFLSSSLACSSFTS